CGSSSMMRMLPALSIANSSSARPVSPARREKDIDLVGPRIDEIETYAPIRRLTYRSWNRTVRDVPTRREHHCIRGSPERAIPHEHVAVKPIARTVGVGLVHAEPHRPVRL